MRQNNQNFDLEERQKYTQPTRPTRPRSQTGDTRQAWFGGLKGAARKDMCHRQGWKRRGDSDGLSLVGTMCQLPLVCIEGMTDHMLSAGALVSIFSDQLQAPGAGASNAAGHHSKIVKIYDEGHAVISYDVEKLQLRFKPEGMTDLDVADAKVFNLRLTTESCMAWINCLTGEPSEACLLDVDCRAGSNGFVLDEEQCALESQAFDKLKQLSNWDGTPIQVMHMRGDEGTRCEGADYDHHVCMGQAIMHLFGCPAGGSTAAKMPELLERFSFSHDCFSRLINKCMPNHRAKGDALNTQAKIVFGENKLAHIASQCAKRKGNQMPEIVRRGKVALEAAMK